MYMIDRCKSKAGMCHDQYSSSVFRQKEKDHFGQNKKNLREKPSVCICR